MTTIEQPGFALIPAIDLRGGRVVRLVEGDFGRETVFSDSPGGVAGVFCAAGAGWVHVVDLDGARSGRPMQTDAVRAIADAMRGRTRVEVAGGLRTLQDVARALDFVDRVVLGTAVLDDPAFVDAVVTTHGRHRVVAAIDVRDDRAVGGAWLPEGASMPLGRVLDRLTGLSIDVAIVTSIARDGTLAGPDLELLARVAQGSGLSVIASGGIRSIDDLLAVRDVGCDGAIVGRALYEGTIDLVAALDRLSTPVQSGNS